MKKLFTPILCLALIFSFALAPAVSWAQDITFPQLVEILISVGAIAPDKVAQARTLANNYNQMQIAQSATSALSSANLWAPVSFSFKQDLKQGTTSSDVLVLQKILNADTSTQVAYSGSGSPGNETSYFGPATKAALLQFQRKYQISETGIVDAKTRTLLNNALIAQRVNALPDAAKPSIIVKANGQTGNVTLQTLSPITLSWDTRNVSDCYTALGSKSITGTQIVANPQPGIYALTCQSAYGPVSGYVTIATSTSSYSSNYNSYGSYTASWDTSSTNNNTTSSGSNSGSNTSAAVNGSCGSANNSSVSYQPTTNLCSLGTAGAVTSTGSGWQWRCSGSNGGASIGCYASMSSQNIASILPTTSTTSTTTTRYLDLSGSTGYMSVQNSYNLQIDNRLTLEAWIKPTAWNGNQIIITKGKDGSNWDYGFFINNGVLEFNNSRAKVSTQNAVVSLGVWSQVAVVVDETASQDNVIFYVNGSKIGGGSIVGDCGNATTSTPSSGTEDVYYNSSSNSDYFTQFFNSSGTSGSNYLASFTNYTQASSDATAPQYLPGTFNKISWLQPSNNPVYVGGYYSSGGLKDKFTGLVDNVRIWNTARTDSQIASNAITLSTSTSNLIGLVANWNFESGIANDTSGNSNNGTLNGSAVISSSQVVTVPSVSGLLNTGYSYTMNQCMDSSSVEEALGPDGPLPPFGGQVVSITKCSNGGGVQTYEVVIQPCSSGGQVGTTKEGDSVNVNAYVVFRENNPPLPSIGDSILGGEVPDSSGKCNVIASTTQPAGSDTDVPYLGVVSGQISTGPSCTNTNTNANGGGEANPGSSKTGSGSGSFEKLGKFFGESQNFTPGGYVYNSYTRPLDWIGIDTPSLGQIYEKAGSIADDVANWF
jgi:hypothetical protein